MAVEGTWKLVVTTPMGTQESTLNVQNSGGSYSATQSAGHGDPRPVDDVEVDGDTIAWKASITKPMSMTLQFSGTVDGDSMSGTVKLGMFGSAKFTGTRT